MGMVRSDGQQDLLNEAVEAHQNGAAIFVARIVVPWGSNQQASAAVPMSPNRSKPSNASAGVSSSSTSFDSSGSAPRSKASTACKCPGGRCRRSSSGSGAPTTCDAGDVACVSKPRTRGSPTTGRGMAGQAATPPSWAARSTNEVASRSGAAK